MNADFFQTLSDPTRLRIVEAMRGRECAVGDLVERVAIRQSGVSRHLRILHDAGLVQVRPDGQRRLYSLRPEPFRDLDAWLDGYRRHWESRLDRLARALEQQRAKRSHLTEPRR